MEQVLCFIINLPLMLSAMLKFLTINGLKLNNFGNIYGLRHLHLLHNRPMAAVEIQLAALAPQPKSESLALFRILTRGWKEVHFDHGFGLWNQLQLKVHHYWTKPAWIRVAGDRESIPFHCRRHLNPYLQILENSSRNRGVSQSVFLENSSKFFEKTEFRGVSQSVFLENSSIEILWIPIQLKVKFGVWLRVFCGKLIRKNFLNTYPVMSQNWIVTQTIFEEAIWLAYLIYASWLLSSEK